MPLRARSAAVCARTPLLRTLPPRALAVMLCVTLANGAVWAAAGVVLHFHSSLTGTAVLAYTLGLRHALDADHICAIDLVTRRLVAAGARPASVGTWFSLGHSTVVVLTCVVVAATAAAVSERFGAFSRVGGIVGTAVSAAFLLLLGAANAYGGLLLVRQTRRLLGVRRRRWLEGPAVVGDGPDGEEDKLVSGGGCLFRVMKKLFKVVDRPWKMYPIGVLFGLGFDTSSEIALLGISAVSASRGTSLWLILIFPALFTSGMCLLDTIDGALMMALYSATADGSGKKDVLKQLYYNVILTCLTVAVACVVGTIQALSLVLIVSNPPGMFWDGVRNVEDRWDIVGGGICAGFVVVGTASVLLHGPWRRWVERNYGPDVGLAHSADLDASRNTGMDAVTTSCNANGTEGALEEGQMHRGHEPSEKNEPNGTRHSKKADSEVQVSEVVSP